MPGYGPLQRDHCRARMCRRAFLVPEQMAVGGMKRTAPETHPVKLAARTMRFVRFILIDAAASADC